MYSSDESFQRSREGYFGVYFPSCEATREINTQITLEGNKYPKNTRVSAETVRHESTYIILFLTRYNESINEYKTTSFTHRPRVSLARFSFCWWRHNRLLMTSQWPDNCDAITWLVNSIHGDNHGQSCKNMKYTYLVMLAQTNPAH